MNDDDFRELIVLVQGQLRQTPGAADIADDRNYLESGKDGDEASMPPPLEHLIGLLEAFERFMAVRDLKTYWTALQTIDANVDGNVPQGAVVEAFPGLAGTADFDLATAPDLSAPREDLRTLISGLRGARTGTMETR